MAVSIWFNQAESVTLGRMKSRSETVVLERRFIPKGQIFIRSGDIGSPAYLIQSGIVEVFILKDSKEIELAKLEAGQIVGEMGLISDSPRTANVRAVTDVNVIVIKRHQFEDKLRDSDATIRAIVQMLAERVLRANETVVEKRSDIEGLKETVETVYKNVAQGLNFEQKRTLQNLVEPHLVALINGITEFQVRLDEEER